MLRLANDYELLAKQAEWRELGLGQSNSQKFGASRTRRRAYL